MSDLEEISQADVQTIMDRFGMKPSSGEVIHNRSKGGGQQYYLAIPTNIAWCRERELLFARAWIERELESYE